MAFLEDPKALSTTSLKEQTEGQRALSSKVLQLNPNLKIVNTLI